MCDEIEWLFVLVHLEDEACPAKRSSAILQFAHLAVGIRMWFRPVDNQYMPSCREEHALEVEMHRAGQGMIDLHAAVAIPTHVLPRPEVPEP